jgi:hypothetical protein
MAEIDNTDTDVPQHDTFDFGSLEVTDREGPPRQLPDSAYEVLPDGEHEYQGDDAPVQ